MTRIIAEISVSLDGFVTGPHPDLDNGLGIGGEALHAWAFSTDPEDRRALREATARSGAVILAAGADLRRRDGLRDGAALASTTVD
ncbi:hypothetical protein AB0F81_13890 [Actinoplanes sp. NPDC024001]|uniref:hypothetical protein n=1 Tax=Actinoplanes sp. NPDC024001 TaxID=3154598 RepID=UPI0033D06A5B